MTGVVLRCPTCGTTQSRPGECDACSEGDVRYFCSNHTPGRWLDQPQCQACGARFGQAPPRPAPASTTTSTLPMREAHRAERPSPAPGRVERSGTVRRRPLPPKDDAEDAPDSPTLVDLLADIAHGATRTHPEDEGAPWPEVARESPRSPFPILGCLGRLALAGFILIALALVALFLIAGGLLQ